MMSHSDKEELLKLIALTENELTFIYSHVSRIQDRLTEIEKKLGIKNSFLEGLPKANYIDLNED